VGLTFAAQAEGSLVVIGSIADNPQPMDRQRLERIYRRKIHVDTRGQPVIPVNLPIEHPVRRSFSYGIFHLWPEEMDDYWNIQYFHGVTPPHVLASEEAVLRFVSMTPGAIGYVRECLVDQRVRVLLKLPVPEPEIPQALTCTASSP
jgi:hypothetical protein